MTWDSSVGDWPWLVLRCATAGRLCLAGCAPYHPEVVSKLSLDSPLWGELSACNSRENAISQLREVMETRDLGKAWESLLDEIQHQGSVYGVTSAAIPHLVDLAPHLPAASRLELWTEIGFLVTAGADRFPSPPAEGLQDGLTAALDTAEVLAVRDFLAGAGSVPNDDSYFALACGALSGHPVGRALEVPLAQFRLHADELLWMWRRGRRGRFR